MPDQHPSSNPAGDDPSNSDEDAVDYKVKYLALQAQHQMQRKRKGGPRSEISIQRSASDTDHGYRAVASTQALGRGIRMLAALFGEISGIVADAEVYLMDRYPADDFDEFTPNLTPEQGKHLAEKRG